MLVQSIFSIIVHISEVYCCATRSAHFQHVICKKPSCLPRAPHTLCLAASLIFFRVAYWRTIVAATVTASAGGLWRLACSLFCCRDACRPGAWAWTCGGFALPAGESGLWGGRLPDWATGTSDWRLATATAIVWLIGR